MTRRWGLLLGGEVFLAAKNTLLSGLSAFSDQLSVFSFQQSALSFQLSAYRGRNCRVPIGLRWGTVAMPVFVRLIVES